MMQTSEVIQWYETVQARARAFGTRYLPYLARGILNWFLGWTSIYLVFGWLAGHPAWTYRGASTIVLAAVCGVGIRLALEVFPRTIRLTSNSIYIRDSNGIWFNCWLKSVSHVSFVPINTKIIAMEMAIAFNRGRTGIRIVGVPAEIVDSVVARIGERLRDAK
jgi:hypothetical protein